MKEHMESQNAPKKQMFYIFRLLKPFCFEDSFGQLPCESDVKNVK